MIALIVLGGCTSDPIRGEARDALFVVDTGNQL